MYFTFAKRRFGLLGRSLTACHCHFLSGIYLLYTFRPVQAWQSFLEASSLYTVYFKCRAAAHMVTGDETSSHESTRQLEGRLYWSCIKSEKYRELAEEQNRY